MNRILNVHMGGGGGGGGEREISFTSIQTLNKTDYFGPALVLGRIYFFAKRLDKYHIIKKLYHL